MNRQTFLQLCEEMAGLYIVDKNNQKVPKYIVYHSGLDTLKKVKKKYLIENR